MSDEFLGLFPTPEEKAARDASREYKQQQKAEPKSAKEKEPEDPQLANADEEVKYVIHSGKVQCPYASPPMGDFIVVDTQRVSLQGKLMATVKDKDGKVNFNFTGVCKHPSQQKPSSPPPCKAVINLGEWENYSETQINGNKALLVKSTIKCKVSGEDIKVIDSGQKATLENVAPYTINKMIISDAYWIDEDGEKQRKLRVNHPVTLYIEIQNFIQGAEIPFQFEDEDNEGWYADERSGTIDENGVVTIKDFQIRPL